MEAEDYDSAAEAVESRRPVPPVTEVKISMDNLWDYFEIREERFEQKDAYGNLKDLSINYRLLLKEEFSLAEGDAYPNSLAVGYEYDNVVKAYQGGTLDFENWTCDGYNGYQDTTRKSEMLDYEGKQLYFEYIFKESSEFSSIQRAENLEFLSAEGTLFLINN